MEPVQEPQVNGQKRDRIEFEDNGHTPGWLKTWVFSKFTITMDADDTSLMTPWNGLVFCHPPHADAEIWCEKAARELENGVVSILLLPAVFNSIYWRNIVYRDAYEIHVLTCPIKKPGAKKQIVNQMALVVFAPRADKETHPLPPVFLLEPDNWEDAYYKRPRNRARFALRR